MRVTSGNKICPLAWQNCSTTAADSLAARVTIWYGFFTAVGSFFRVLFGNRILSKPAPPPLPTCNYDWDILQDLASTQFHEHEHIKDTESGCNYDKEVAGHHRVGVIANEGHP